MALSDYRTRLFLLMPADASMAASSLDSVLVAGDVACLLLPAGLGKADAHALVRAGQAHDVAVLVPDDTQLAGQIGADGVHATGPRVLDDEAIARHRRDGMIVGCEGINSRHLALEVGERGMDYLFFGRTDRPLEAETHPKTATLASWWAQMMAVPCVALAGLADEAVDALALAGVEFVAVREHVWRAADPAAEVTRLNLRLDAIARQRMEAAA